MTRLADIATATLLGLVLALLLTVALSGEDMQLAAALRQLMGV